MTTHTRFWSSVNLAVSPAMHCSKRSPTALQRYAKSLEEADLAQAPNPILWVEHDGTMDFFNDWFDW